MIIDFLKQGNHASVIDIVPEFRGKCAPEGFFAHYSMLIGRWGEALQDCSHPIWRVRKCHWHWPRDAVVPPLGIGAYRRSWPSSALIFAAGSSWR
jgi:hypothetical protein